MPCRWSGRLFSWSRGLQGPASRPVKNEHRTTSVPNRTAPAWACLGGRSSPGPDRQHGLAVGFQENERRCKGVRHMTPAEREKLRRERRKAGDRCYRITVNETDLEWALEYTPFTFANDFNSDGTHQIVLSKELIDGLTDDGLRILHIEPKKSVALGPDAAVLTALSGNNSEAAGQDNFAGFIDDLEELLRFTSGGADSAAIPDHRARPWQGASGASLKRWHQSDVMAERSRHISGEARVAQLRRELDRCSDPDKARPKRNELRRLRATSLGSSISVKLQLAARRGREGARHDRHSAPRFCLLEILAIGCANVLKKKPRAGS